MCLKNVSHKNRGRAVFAFTTRAIVNSERGGGERGPELPVSAYHDATATTLHDSGLGARVVMAEL